MNIAYLGTHPAIASTQHQQRSNVFAALRANALTLTRVRYISKKVKRQFDAIDRFGVRVSKIATTILVLGRITLGTIYLVGFHFGYAHFGYAH